MALRPMANPLVELLNPLTSPSLRSALTTPVLRRIYLPAALVPAVSPILTLPSLLRDIWDSVLRAVPKKKTSYSKKRMRQMAGKALKDVTALNTCAGCGRPKRMHVLCPYCVQDIKNYFRDQMNKDRTAVVEAEEQKLELLDNPELDPRERSIQIAQSHVGKSKKTWFASATPSLRRAVSDKEGAAMIEEAVADAKRKESADGVRGNP
ncbi:hypothetical protein NA57DRAFT_73896 [Rhizodiscina lignyota]|uniref:Large ribosomal subunit protein bL32m n=1 Tax=Rhizodiscina lignyota TaxID=1504668 RepID=A0A9P4MAE0_9PEZI|nr:hypothetical protein NA57DRAFT_73896 [Rhizodiscina lignyota]